MCAQGRLKQSFDEFKQHEVYFGTRSDDKFNEKHNMWYGVCSLLVMATVDIPEKGTTLTTPLLPGSRMTHDQVQQCIYSAQNGRGPTFCGASGSLNQAILSKMKHKV